MRIAHGDLISGLSGDMFVAALLDLGLPLATLQAELRKIPALRFHLKVGNKKLHALRAKRFRVLDNTPKEERSWREIRLLIKRSSLTPEVKERTIDIFHRLAQAEGKVHGVAPERVHFHEVGATDSIVDIAAAAIAVHHFKITSFSFSPVPLGRGLTASRHGMLPLPGPATLELLKGIPVEGTDLAGETVTPTGAAIIATLGRKFGAPPAMTIERIGYGAGEREFPDRPNIFRIILGQTKQNLQHEEMVVLETNIDDMNPEIYDYVMEQLFQARARDVFLTPIQMKKNRPATMLSVIAEPSRIETMTEILFRETSTAGIRCYPVRRMILKRASKTVTTRFGTVRVKIIDQPDGTRRATPEYEDLKRIATRKKIPLKLLYDETLRTFGYPQKIGTRRKPA
jgi:pyridinium-3,5-bisthiocarboxylic acid mononucleotide nickel chelatase